MELCFAVPERKRNSEQRRTLGQVTFMMFVFVTDNVLEKTNTMEKWLSFVFLLYHSLLLQNKLLGAAKRWQIILTTTLLVDTRVGRVRENWVFRVTKSVNLIIWINFKILYKFLCISKKLQKICNLIWNIITTTTLFQGGHWQHYIYRNLVLYNLYMYGIIVKVMELYCFKLGLWVLNLQCNGTPTRQL